MYHNRVVNSCFSYKCFFFQIGRYTVTSVDKTLFIITHRGSRRSRNSKKDWLKVDREDYFKRPGFLHIIICILLGYKALNFVEKMDVTDVKKTSKFERFARESRPRPF